MAKEDIILGACDIYMYEFTGTELPTDAEIETEAHDVGHCSGGFAVSYKPTPYDVVNQYGKTVKRFIVKEEVTAKTGVISWDLKNLALLSTASVTETLEKRTLTFTGRGQSLKKLLLRAVHTKDDGNKIRFTMIGNGGSGFEIEFAQKELTIDAEITAISAIDGFLASIEEEI